MDRLSALTARLGVVVVIGTLGGCDEKPRGEPVGRANSAKVAPTHGADPASFCDKVYSADTGPTLTYPAVVDGTLPAPTNRPRWVNVWATWCKPCVEEIPRLLQWHDKLAGGGKPFDLVFISVDEDAADVADFRTDQARAPATRVAAPQDQGAWYTSLGLDAAATLPIHLFVTATGHVRCARAGAVREKDYAVVEKLLSP